MARLASVVCVCRSPLEVEAAAAFLTTTLRLPAVAPPPHLDIGSLQSGATTATVGVGGVSVHLMHLPRLSRYRLREDVHRPAVVYGCLLGGEGVAAPPQLHAMKDARTIMSLATGVGFQPRMVAVPEEAQGDAAPPSPMTVKEVVFGLPVEALQAVSGQLRALGVRPHAAHASVWETGGGPALRLLPSSFSALVLGVEPGTLDAWKDAVDASDSAARAALCGCRAGFDLKPDLGIVHPALAGLDLRLSETPALQPFFVECASSMEEDTHPDFQPASERVQSVSCQAATLTDVTAFVKSSTRWMKRV